MHVSLLIQNAQILMPDGTFQTGSVAIASDTIVQVGETDATADRTIDATGLVLLPGVIDPQVHFREPGLEHKRTSTLPVLPASGAASPPS
jgi:dihydroorotase